MCSLSEFGRLSIAALIVLAFLGPIPATAPQATLPATPCDTLIGAIQSDAQKTRLSICNIVLSGRIADLRRSDISKEREALKKFYAPEYSAAWNQSGQPTAQARTLIDLIQSASEKGLDPDDYDGAGWPDRLQRLATQESPPAELANFDVVLTVAAMRYVSDLHLGRVRSEMGGIVLPPKKLDGADFLRSKVVSSGDVRTAIQQLEPPFPEYWQMLTALQRYKQLARAIPGNVETFVPAVVKPVLPGQTFADSSTVAGRLRELGELSNDAQLLEKPDSYDGVIVAAVRHFQRTHGLADDGRLTPQTLAELNVPLASRVMRIKLTLERWRWLPASLHPPLVIVNVPEFQLRAFTDGSSAFTTRVVVGKAYDHQTPLFADEMEYIIFRPYWNVPVSITRNEIIPALRRNSDYLARRNMEVTTHDGGVITESPDPGTLRELRAGKLEIRQRPGGANSLGLIKFVFPNEYDVYLHGTPERRLFERTRRDFSHGCVRVQDPEGLAAWVLRNDASWTRERIRSAMNGDRTLTVTLPEHIPVVIFYATTAIDDKGEVSFYPDIYRLDASLERALAISRP